MKVFLIAGEHSGDQLGGKLIAAIRNEANVPVTFSGLGDVAMMAEGLDPIFPMSEVAVMGPTEILLRLPNLVSRVHETVRKALAADPDVVVIIDSPEFTHPIAKRIRKKRPDIPIIDYVCPSVWAWRPGRARKMAGYIDHVLALLPFEPDALAALNGPKSSYVGHPLIEKIDWISEQNPDALKQRLGIHADKQVLTVLPGSRASELKHLIGPFGQSIEILAKKSDPFEVIIPAVSHLKKIIEAKTADWPVKVHLTETESDKYAAFRSARAILAASGTVTLEIALAGTPMLACYKIGPITGPIIKRLINVPSVLLANLILGRNIFPELVQEECKTWNIVDLMLPLIEGGAERDAQINAFPEIRSKLLLSDQLTPSHAASKIVLQYARNGRNNRV